MSHYFLKLFGRPVRKTACECERNAEASIAQVLHLLNSPQLQAKIAHEAGTVARLVRSNSDNHALLEELYLTFYSRFPTREERVKLVYAVKVRITQDSTRDLKPGLPADVVLGH